MTAQSAENIPISDNIRAVWHSGLYRKREVAAGIYWLDDETILVSANNGPKPSTREALREAVDWLYVWRIGDKPWPYGSDPQLAARSYCGARGEVRYQWEAKDPTTGSTSRMGRQGPIGKEREVPFRDALSLGRTENPLSIEKIDCEVYADPAMAGRHYVTDPEHRFYLDFGKDPTLAAVHAASEEPLVLINSNGSDRTELPISNASVRAASVYYRQFESVFYVFNGILTVSPINRLEQWRGSNCWPIWRIDPQAAKTEKLCIPFGPWAGVAHGGQATAIELAPTMAGLFFSSNHIKASEEHGFYLLRDGRVTRVLSGAVWSPITSPNGCRVAFVHIPNDEAERPLSSDIVVIDVCSADSKVPSFSK